MFRNRFLLLALVGISCCFRLSSGLFAHTRSTGIISLVSNILKPVCLSFQIHYSLKEISGLTPSNLTDSILYAIEDSGNGSFVYAFTNNGRKAGRIKLKNARNRDWEDIASGPGPEAGINYIYVADIGNNFHIRKRVSVYRFSEPLLETLKQNTDQVLNAKEIKLKYPDGKFDAEALLVDPRTADLYIVTKQINRCSIYKAVQQEGEQISTMRKIASLPIGSITAAAISRKRDILILKNLDDIFCWRIRKNQLIETVFHSKPVKLRYEKELQGESLCIEGNSKGYFTSSELRRKGNPELRFYPFTDENQPPR